MAVVVRAWVGMGWVAVVWEPLMAMAALVTAAAQKAGWGVELEASEMATGAVHP